jgi:hypothetical protein
MQPGVDKEKRLKVVAMYQWLAEFYAAARPKV